MEKDIISSLNKKNLSSSSINLYMNTLRKLNDKKEVKNLKFLTKPTAILDKIKNYKPTTQRNIIISIVSILKAIENPLATKYYDIMIDMTKKINNDNKLNEKTEKQKENWMTWEDVVKKLDEMQKTLKISKKITETQYNQLLELVVLSLYVMIQPRRNKDYIDMVITKNDTNDKTKNYLDIKKQQFIFNVYKTSKKDGQLIITIPDDLFKIIKLYLKYHPMKQQITIDKQNIQFLDNNIPFLVHFDKTPLKDNGITRILNKIFNKKIGSSMLRHIYLSSKYGDILEEQKNDAKMMSHTVQTAKDYIKLDK